ncbi:MAG: MBL fold metallo-hydrolase [Anaerolineae bacterium]|nr:MBL fold metallo-hydrolase [Anaerolineae bacterium]
MTIHHLDCGPMRPIWPNTKAVTHCLLVETNDGLLLVDTGFGVADVTRPTRFMRAFTALLRTGRNVEDTALRQLTRLGYDPTDVRHIVLTHLHLDHAGGLPDFPQAQVHIYAAEYEASRRPTHPSTWFYQPGQWAHGPNWVIHHLTGETWYGFDAIDILPGLSPRVLLTPLTGHTRGHCGVAIETGAGDQSAPAGRWLLHYGDGAYPFYNEGRTWRLFSNPPLELDRWFLGDNTGRLKALLQAHGDEITFISAHDPADFEKFTTEETLS